MSLGFLTESALVPSKAKGIKVDAKSLVDLKAVVFQKDQERKRRLQDALTMENDDDDNFVGHKAFRLGKYAHLRGGSKRHKQSKEDRVGRKCQNSGVEARCQRDEEAKARDVPDKDDDAAWSKLSVEMLRKKAKLYEELSNGIGIERMNGECLVDFEAKKDTGSSEATTMVEILDEFGRTRSVAMDSEEYLTLQDTQKKFDKEQLNPKNLLNEGHNQDEEAKSDGGSFVVSQWEKCLKSTEKDHLREVHEQANRMQLLAQRTTAGAVDKKTRNQLRLERLRKQREEVPTSSESAALANAAVDYAASEQATDFLKQLSSLM
ncbi:unnamed protein product [Peronospora belbahrii]|uniref:NUC153 domain-containing protein n=1 Tax=Peronospora belbahrii TaxID=622444 RepID=A0ABN8CRP6_9STRA|nr:unnamed protein product [Peronospora belbahrii]